MEKFFGIDVGGTNIKVGLVDDKGNLLNKNKYRTKDKPEFVPYFIEVLGHEFEENPMVDKVGVGVPGVLSKDRSTLLEIPNIPNLNGVNLKQALDDKFPDKQFHLENDAAAAALGEYYFSGEKMPENYVFITLGTGVGGGAIIDHKIFKGGDGNSMEIGHVLSSNGKTLEKNIGKKGIMKRYKALKSKYKSSSVHKLDEIEPKYIAKEGLDGDDLGKKIFEEVGVYLGEALVGVIRLFDIKVIILGGGLSVAIDLLTKPMNKIFKKHLTSYYTDNIEIRRANLKNEAGIIGAASLCF